MERHIENVIYQNASKCFEHLKESIEIFKKLLPENNIISSPDYYRARKLLRKGESCFQETLKNAKKLLGPAPDYVAEEFKKWRKGILEEYDILAKSQSIENLHAEMTHDKLMSQLLSEAEIKVFLDKHFIPQQKGKRELANIKVRIIIDKLKELLLEAQLKQKEAQKRERLKS